MAVLSPELRNRLENTIKTARRQAEIAAKAALERLTVRQAEPGGHLTPEERQVRNRLRAHGRQLGDQRDPKTGTQSTNRLIHECAYEHWHRMLFARFLSENHLLMHPDGVAVTLAECDELAPEENAPDGWTLAARYAARMLPQIFRPDDRVLQIGFAPEHKRGLEKMVTDLPVEVFTAEDSLGWVYQFWQAERKDEVNASGDKITGETLPAVTQLFTEHYMVLFLLHNTIGAWWAAKQKSEGRVQKSEWEKCETEDDCRKLVALPGYEFTYLRFIRDGNGEWVPAAGGFPGWPKLLRDFKLLDPCCGSGHFLIAAFVLLALMRMQDEKLSANDACDAVLRENIHGLELDPRCTQIAAFALALTAWKFTGAFRPLPPLNIACSGLGVNARKEDWLALANGDTRLHAGLEQLYDLFQIAPELGSLINPRQLANGDLLTASFAEIQPPLTKALQSEMTRKNADLNEIGVAAQGMAHAAELLAGHNHLILTNVPYLGTRKQSDTLLKFLKQKFFASRFDLATAFIQRCFQSTVDGGAVALVTPKNWHFLTSYQSFRRELLSTTSWVVLANLGTKAFETIGGEVVNVALSVFENRPPVSEASFAGFDVTNGAGCADKANLLRQGTSLRVSQGAQLKNPNTVILFDPQGTTSLLIDHAVALAGILNGDTQRFRFQFWEVVELGEAKWAFLQESVEETSDYSGRSTVLLWESGNGQLRSFARECKERLHDADRRGNEAWGKWGVAVSRMGKVAATIYTGDLFDQNVAVILPKDERLLAPIWAFCRSEEYYKAVRRIDQKLNVTNATLAKVPFDLAKWQQVAAAIYPNGLPEPNSNDPTQWLFNGRLADSKAPLQTGVARLLGYRWPRQNGQTVAGASPVPKDGLENLVDEDGIVCIPSVRGEQPAAERLRGLLTNAYGQAWTPALQEELLSAAGFEGSTLEDWLRNGFCDQHCKLFHNRPFIWHIWDGGTDGFSALVNYHKLDHKLLEKLTYTYLGDWIKRQQEAVNNEESGADDRLLKARQLQDKLKLILEGEAPYDIFVRWKSLEQQPIGWHPDLNDGVRQNIRPFVEADVLRKRPNTKWGIDRGKNPPGSPWGEERDNDRHLTLAEKQRARVERRVLRSGE